MLIFGSTFRHSFSVRIIEYVLVSVSTVRQSLPVSENETSVTCRFVYKGRPLTVGLEPTQSLGRTDKQTNLSLGAPAKDSERSSLGKVKNSGVQCFYFGKLIFHPTFLRFLKIALPEPEDFVEF